MDSGAQILHCGSSSANGVWHPEHPTALEPPVGCTRLLGKQENPASITRVPAPLQWLLPGTPQPRDQWLWSKQDAEHRKTQRRLWQPQSTRNQSPGWGHPSSGRQLPSQHTAALLTCCPVPTEIYFSSSLAEAGTLRATRPPCPYKYASGRVYGDGWCGGLHCG